MLYYNHIVYYKEIIMKRIQLSILTCLLSTNFMMAGGDLLVVTPYEVEDIVASEEVEIVTPVIATPPVEVVAPPVKEVVAPPVVVAEPPRPPAPSKVSVSPLYLGIGLSAGRYSTNCGCASKSGVDKTVGGVVRAGYDFNKYLGVEARALMTPLKEDGGKIKHIGAFIKPMYPVTDGLNVYGLGGIAKTTTEGHLRKTDVTGLALGAGVEYDLSSDTKKEGKYNREFDGKGDQEKGLGVFADYERLFYKKNSPDLDAVSVGVTYDF